MYYLSLSNINRELSLNISHQKLQKLDELLSSVPFGGTVSPYYLSSESAITKDMVVKLLTILSNRNIISTQFILKCENDDEDFLHSYEFTTEELLLDFLKNTQGNCPNCDSKLGNIAVFFKVKNSSLVNNNE